MRARILIAIVATAGCCWLAVSSTPQRTVAAQAADSAPPAANDVAALLAQLGDEDYKRREEATQQLLKLGPPIAPALLDRLAAESDPEVRHRLRFVLECVVPPDHAVLVLNAAPASGLTPGDLITHVGAWRIRHSSELRNVMNESANTPVSLRVAGAAGPRDIARFDRSALYAFCDYVSPRGASIANALHLYMAGRAEQAEEALATLGSDVGEEELPTLLRARLLAVAGRMSDALKLLATTPDVVKPAENENRWQGASTLDRALPGKSPLYLEWTLWNLVREGVEDDGDPDLRTQRILVPAGRYVDALHAAAGYWTQRFRDVIGAGEPQTRNAGNMLAVSSWMLYELSLLSECERLIEPRSLILQHSPNSPHKWLRVQTDAWRPFFAGDVEGATKSLFVDALDVLQNPLGMGPGQLLIRNPVIAAQIAFFLYQAPGDPRVREALDAVNRRDSTGTGLPAYLNWMLFALRAENATVIREHFDESLPNLSGADATRLLVRRTLLEYAHEKRDPAVLKSLRERLAAPTGEAAASAESLALVDVLTALVTSRLDEAESNMAALESAPGSVALRHTLAFLRNPPSAAAAHAALKNPLLAMPLGSGQDKWIVLTAGRQLQVFNVASAELTPLDPPTPNWYPGPRNWPWLGRDDTSGRVFAYGVRRVFEIGSEATPNAEPLRLNIRADEIAAFERTVAPVFGAVADAVSSLRRDAAEDGEYLRSELSANLEYTSDPDLPELALIRPALQDDRLVHIAFRGGPHLLLDRASGRTWSSRTIASALHLPNTPAFFVEAQWREGDAPPAALLLSDQGLIRFLGATNEFQRIALPGDAPYPELIPESAPYIRRDPQRAYFARTPDDGGQVYRLTLATGEIEAVDLINMAVPLDYYTVQSRSALRRELDQRFESTQILPLEGYVADVVQTVRKWHEAPQ